MAKGFTHARLACGCRITFREGVEGSPVTVVVDEKSPDLPAAERGRIASAVGVGAIKYADLASDRIKDYVFDWNRMLSFEGNTAPYLMYAHARIRSILRKAAEACHPHRLCAFLYDVASAFTSFYEACPVLKSEGGTRASRLALCDLTARTLALGLDLLGISAPDQM